MNEKRGRGQRMGHTFAEVIDEALKVEAFVEARRAADPIRYGARERAVRAAVAELYKSRRVIDRALSAAKRYRPVLNKLERAPIALVHLVLSAKKSRRKSMPRK